MTTQVDPNRADSSKPSPEQTPDTAKSITFTPAQLIAWADNQEKYLEGWVKSEEMRNGYTMAMRHLRYHLKNPIQEII